MNRSRSLFNNARVFSILSIGMYVVGTISLNQKFISISFTLFIIMTISLLLSVYYCDGPKQTNRFLDVFSYILLLPVACIIFITVFVFEFATELSKLIFYKKGGERDNESVETMRDGTA